MTDRETLLTRAALWLICVLAAFAAARIASDWPIWSHSKAAEWVGAIGTVGAFIGTVILATEESRRRRKEEYDLACLIAFRSFTPVVLMHAQATQAREILLTQMKTDLRRIYFKMAADALASEVSVSQDDLAGMVALPKHMARKLAEALGSREAAKEMLAATLDDARSNNAADYHYRWETAAQVAGILEVSIQRSEFAIKELRLLIAQSSAGDS